MIRIDKNQLINFNVEEKEIFIKGIKKDER